MIGSPPQRGYSVMLLPPMLSGSVLLTTKPASSFPSACLSGPLSSALLLSGMASASPPSHPPTFSRATARALFSGRALPLILLHPSLVLRCCTPRPGSFPSPWLQHPRRTLISLLHQLLLLPLLSTCRLSARRACILQLARHASCVGRAAATRRTSSTLTALAPPGRCLMWRI